MTTHLRERLAATDPAARSTDLTPGEKAHRLERLLLKVPDEPGPAAVPVPRRSFRRPALTGATLLVTAAAVAVAVSGSTPTTRVPGPPSAGGTDPGAVRLEVEKLAAQTVDAPSGYLYVKASSRYLEGGFDLDDRPVRNWASQVRESWTGWTCDDRQKETYDPIAFPTERERQAYRAAPVPWAPDALTGWVSDVRGRELLALDSVPCGRMGSIGHPNPRYVATYPTSPEAFAAKADADQAAEKEPVQFASSADLIMSVLETPWLTDDQRSAGLLAWQSRQTTWRVGGHETVAGIPGLLLLRDGPENGTRQEMVISARAPGLLRDAEILVDPVRAAATTITKAHGLPAGTVLSQSRVLEVGAVPDLESTP